MRTLLFLLLLTPLAGISAQEDGVKFYAESHEDPSSPGNYIVVDFVLENGEGGRFTPPDWNSAGCRVIAGPSQSSSISIFNGVRKSELRYRYYIAPQASGELVIPPARIETGSGALESEPLVLNLKSGAVPPARPLKSLRPTIRI
jgi:hypothetical protein